MVPEITRLTYLDCPVYLGLGENSALMHGVSHIPPFGQCELETYNLVLDKLGSEMGVDPSPHNDGVVGGIARGDAG